MSTQFTNRQWRLPNNENKDKQSNYSMDFDGTNDVINCGLNAPFNAASTNFSISLWCKSPNSFTDSGNLVESRLSYANPDGIAIEFVTNTMYFRKSGSTFGKTITEWGLNNTNWNHIVYTYDLTLAGNVDKIFVYINGVFLSSAPQAATSQPASTGDFTIGDGLRGNFNGSIDQVSVFDYTLSASQVATLYGSSSTGIGNPMSLSPKPVAYYPLGDKDAFNGANYLVPNIAAQEDDGDIAVSYSPYALDFDSASSGYIEITNSSDLQLINTDFSISFWLNPTSRHNGMVIQNYKSNFGGWGVYNVSGNLRFISMTGPQAWQTLTTLSTSQWTHILIVGDDTGNNLLCYKNGVEVYNASYAINITSTPNNTFIGSENGTVLFFNGSISNCSIWNAALTQSQVTEIYNEGVPSNLNNHSAYSNLVSWWQLGSNSSFNTNWNVLDEKGTNNGTSINMTEADIVDGIGSYANGLSSGMGGDEVIGDAPYSTANSLSINMDVLDRVTGISNATITTAGTGYTTGTNITTTGGTGSGCTVDITASGAMTAVTINNSGLGYSVGEVLTVVQSGESSGTITVTSLNTPS